MNEAKTKTREVTLMKRTTLTATALVLGLTLAGCSVDDDANTADTPAAEDTTTEDAATEGDAGDDASETADDAATSEGGDAAAAPMSDQVCADFFQNVGNTLADRSDAARTALDEGSVTDPASWGEVNLLKQRIESLTEDASAEQATLLERINAPFVEASDAVLEDEEASPSDAEISVPEIDVTDSEAAQEEFLASCSG